MTSPGRAARAREPRLTVGRGAGRRLSGSQACSGASHEEDPLACRGRPSHDEDFDEDGEEFDESDSEDFSSDDDEDDLAMDLPPANEEYEDVD